MIEAAAVVAGFAAYGAVLAVVLQRLAGDPLRPEFIVWSTAACGGMAAGAWAIRWIVGG